MKPKPGASNRLVALLAAGAGALAVAREDYAPASFLYFMALGFLLLGVKESD